MVASWWRHSGVVVASWWRHGGVMVALVYALKPYSPFRAVATAPEKTPTEKVKFSEL